jgi:hypothetical protein
MLLSLNTKTHKTFSVAVTKYEIISRAVMYQQMGNGSGAGGALASKTMQIFFNCNCAREFASFVHISNTRTNHICILIQLHGLDVYLVKRKNATLLPYATENFISISH